MRLALPLLLAASVASAQTEPPSTVLPSAIPDQQARADVKADAAKLSAALRELTGQAKLVETAAAQTIAEVNEKSEAAARLLEGGALEVSLKTTVRKVGQGWNNGDLVVVKTADVIVAADGSVISATLLFQCIDADHYPDFDFYAVDNYRYKIPPGSKDFEAAWREAMRLLN